MPAVNVWYLLGTTLVNVYSQIGQYKCIKCQISVGTFLMQHRSQINRMIQVLLSAYYLLGTILMQFTHKRRKQEHKEHLVFLSTVLIQHNP